MKKNEIFSKLDPIVKTILMQIGKEAESQMCSAYLVGGIVRDLLIGKENYDLDVVIVGNGVSLAEHMAEIWKANAKTYPKFGTATVEHGNLKIDFVTARKEIYETPAALPIVSKGTLLDDLFRRDFTINAMALSLNQADLGQIIDPYGGQKDLKTGVLRVLHEQSFRDDPTRILRGVRFQKRFGFRFDRKTNHLLKACLKSECHRRVSQPRYFDQFVLLFKEPDPVSNLKQFIKLGSIDWFNSIDVKNINNFQKFINEFKLEQKFGKDRLWVIYSLILMVDWDEDRIDQSLKQWQIPRQDAKILRQTTLAKIIAKDLETGKLPVKEVYQRYHSLSQEVIWSIMFLIHSEKIKKEIYLLIKANFK